MREITIKEVKKYGCRYCIDGRKKGRGIKCPFEKCMYAKYIDPYGNYEKFCKTQDAFFEVLRDMNKEENKNGKK